MALWGKKDHKVANTASQGATVASDKVTITFAAGVTADTIVAGDWLTLTGEGTGLIKSVDSTTQATFTDEVKQVSSVNAWYTHESPKWVDSTSEVGVTTVYGVDATEQAVSKAAAVGTAGSAVNAPAHAGWVERIDRGASRKPRYRYNTLVAMGSISSDAEDTAFADS